MDGTIGIGKPGALDYLCELIIDELKNFSSSRQCISPSSLLRALSSRAEILEFLGSQDHIKELKSAYIKILNELNDFLGEQYKEQLDELIARINVADSLIILYLLLDEIVALVRTCISRSQDKEKALASLVIEISTQLVEVEKKCLCLIENSTLTHRANSLFNNMLESQIADFETSAKSCEDVLEVRGIIRAKLDAIKSALETKKTEDQVREVVFESTIENLKTNLKVMEEKIDRGQRRRKHLEQEVLIDPLTGIANRRAMERHIRKEMKKYKRYKTVFSLIFIDIDDFKRVNDSYGHWVGDKCMKSLVGRIKQILRETDLIARYGGDEFIIFTTATERKAAQAVANKLSNAISKTCFIYKNSKIQLSVSIGVTQVEETDDGLGEIISRVDSALYEAKNQGKNRVVVV
jgi:diguanylate cyclase